MKQRLGIAAALMRNPRLLVLDEPTTGLDPAGMRDMRDLVRRLASEGLTVLLSSHLMSEVEDLCNRVAIIRTGQILFDGDLDELLQERRRGAPDPHRRPRPRRPRSPSGWASAPARPAATSWS